MIPEERNSYTLTEEESLSYLQLQSLSLFITDLKKIHHNQIHLKTSRK